MPSSAGSRDHRDTGKKRQTIARTDKPQEVADKGRGVGSGGAAGPAMKQQLQVAEEQLEWEARPRGGNSDDRNACTRKEVGRSPRQPHTQAVQTGGAGRLRESDIHGPRAREKFQRTC